MSKFSSMFPSTIALFSLTSCGGGSSNLITSPPLVIPSSTPPTGTTGAAYAGTSGFALTASGGVAPYTWSWLAAANSSLPPGLTLTQSSIAGTPTTPGAYGVVVTVRDSASPANTRSDTYAVSIDLALEITSGIPPNGMLGIGYGPLGTAYFSCVWSPVLGWHWACTPCDPPVPGSCPATPCRGISLTRCLQTQRIPVGFTFTGSGGTSPYTWSATRVLPGLRLDAHTGDFAGTPSTVGSYNVIVTVSDSESPGVHVSASYSIEVSN
jgi:large repetitive protein